MKNKEKKKQASAASSEQKRGARAADKTKGAAGEGQSAPEAYPLCGLLFYRGAPLLSYRIDLPARSDLPPFLSEMASGFARYLNGAGFAACAALFDADDRRHKRLFYPLTASLTFLVGRTDPVFSCRLLYRLPDREGQMAFCWDNKREIFLCPADFGIQGKKRYRPDLFCQSDGALVRFAPDGSVQPLGRLLEDFARRQFFEKKERGS